MNRYIKSVHIKNFQSYKDQVINLEPGLNLLVGTSDSGKSAILRAISFVLYNYPKKDTLIHFGEKETSVTLEFSDGVKVTRIKGDGRNAIIAVDANGKKIEKEKIDTEIPDEIKELLGNPPQDDFNGLISYADQFSKMFLVDLSPSELPRSLSNLTGIEVLEESAKKLMQNYKAIDKLNKSDELELKKLKKELEGYDILDKHTEDISSIEAMIEKVSNIETEIAQMEPFCEIDMNVKEEDISGIDLMLARIKSTRSEIKALTEIVDQINKLQIFSLLNEHVDVNPDGINGLLDLVQTLKGKVKNCSVVCKNIDDLNQRIKNYDTIKESGQRLTEDYKSLSSELESQKKEHMDLREKMIKENILCDKCGGVLK